MTPVMPYKNDLVLEDVNYLPSVSIIIPFEPKMTFKKELEYQLERVVEKVHRALIENYVNEKVMAVMDRLRTLISTLDFTTFKKSLAIFVSPLLQKVHYLDIPVEERIVIDTSFEVRDLVYSKKDIHKYLVLVLSSNRSQLFLGNSTTFFRLTYNTPLYHDCPERVGNFSDPSAHREVLLHKFLHQVDTSLGVILNAYQLPLFVLATERVMGHFKKISRHTGDIIGYVHGNFDEVSEAAIREAIAPEVADWKKVKNDNLVLKLDAAKGAGKLAVGMREVWKEVVEHRGRLLVVEKNYVCPADYTGDATLIVPHDPNSNSNFFIKDAVDDVIERVLQHGGDVEFVEEGMLHDYQHIALIKFY